MGALRERMKRDMAIRGYAKKTQDSYLKRVHDFVVYHGRSPEELTIEDINDYQYHLIEERRASWAIFNQTVCALKFLYGVTLGKEWMIKHIPHRKRPRKVPVVLSVQEVLSLLTETGGRSGPGPRWWKAHRHGPVLFTRRVTRGKLCPLLEPKPWRSRSSASPAFAPTARPPTWTRPSPKAPRS